MLLQCTLFLHASSFIRSSGLSLLVRLCTKYEMHRGKTTARNQTRTERCPGVRCKKFSPFTLPTLSGYYVQPSPESRDQVVETEPNGRENQFDQGGGTYRERIEWGRLHRMTSLVWCPAWQLKARI